MWIIEYFSQKDYKIDCDNWRRYKVSDEELILLENNFNFSNNISFSWDEKYKNVITETCMYFNNNFFDINYRDINFESNEIIKFKINFYNGNTKWYITPEFIEELHDIFLKDQCSKNKEYELNVYLEDEKKWNYYQIWIMTIRFWFEWGWFLSSSYQIVSFIEEYQFNKFDFILYIAERYFWVKQNDTYENFQFKQ